MIRCLFSIVKVITFTMLKRCRKYFVIGIVITA
nr:MAG TPA: hypothetical protein [Caudoviricetes sp.]